MSEITKQKSRLEIAEEKKARLLAETAKTKDNIKYLKAQARRLEAKAQRAINNRVKTHAGGIVEMTGLLRYVYPDDVIHDNEQDALIANLLAGVLLKVGSTLEKASVDDLKNLWEQGQDFRNKNKADRVVSNINPNLDLLFDKLNLKITDTIRQPNDNDNLEKSHIVEVKSENGN